MSKLVVACLVFSVLGSGSSFADVDGDQPNNHAQIPPVWRVPDGEQWDRISGRGDVVWENDRWIWDAEPVDQGGVAGVRIPVDMGNYDELRLEYKPTYGPVSLQVTADGYPDENLSRNWYDKHPLKLNEWNSLALDLNLDDDGLSTSRPGGQDIWLNFRAIPATENDDPSRRTVEFRHVRLVRHPVEWEIDYFRARIRMLENGDCEISYPIAIRSRSSEPVNVSLSIDREPPRTGEPLFEKPSPETLSWTLHPNPSLDDSSMSERWGGDWAELPGDTVSEWITFRAPAEDLQKRSPLWTEIVHPRLHVKGHEEPVLPLHSSRIDPWFLVVPPDEHLTPGLEATPEAIERAHVRNAENPQFEGVMDDYLARAERILAIPRVTYELPEDAYEPAGADWRDRIRPQFRNYWFVPRQNYRITGTVLGMSAIEANRHNASRARKLARAYALTGREDFRKGALEVLNAYADYYPYWEAMRESSTAFRSPAAVHTLSTGFTFPDYFVAYDYLRHTLTLDEMRHIEDRFLRPLAQVVDGHVNDYNNQLTVHNLIPFFYAMTTGNWPLAMRYVEGPRGLYKMRQYGFDVDGMGMEHDMGYHWNSLDPMIRKLTSLDFYGYDSSELDMYSTLQLPIIMATDPREMRVGGPFSFRYEWAYAHYRDPLLSMPVARRADGKRSIHGLLMGADALPPMGDIELEPAHLENAGYVTLRHVLSDADIRSISVNYGSPRYRLHIDRLSVIVRENGNILTGMMGQGQGRLGRYSTMANSLLIVNGRDQVLGRGRLVNKYQGEDWTGLHVATRQDMPIYQPEVDYHRLVVSLPHAVVLLDKARSPEPADFQWTFYPGKDMEVPDGWAESEHPDLKPSEIDNAGPLSPVRRKWRTSAEMMHKLQVNASVRGDEKPMPVHLITQPRQNPYAFETPGYQEGGWIDALLLYARNQQSANWAAVLPRTEGEVNIEWVDVTDAGGAVMGRGESAAVSVETPAGRWIIAVADEVEADVRGHNLENGWLVKKVE